MAAGLAATGKDPITGKPRSLADYRDQMRAVLQQGLVDILLMSASTSDLLTIHEKRFENSHVTPAVRANDTTDVHLARGGHYAEHPAHPFRSMSIDHAQCGHLLV